MIILDTLCIIRSIHVFSLFFEVYNEFMLSLMLIDYKKNYKKSVGAVIFQLKLFFFINFINRTVLTNNCIIL